ncbi:hypothetical protein PIB30_021183 [Stylosanthes scabra]|uniref:Ninja-family protein n=1 Tax=Stylosanthes scabra TaxID=79078 RepID=A0ABU6T8J4_9FABA|nr:hypothetical protein [Stylosanthes scabra]
MEGLFGSTLTTTNREDQNIDLTLKLSPCGQIEEQKWVTVTRSSSSVIYGVRAKRDEENGRKEEDPFVPWLERSWSMPAKAKKGIVMRFGGMQTMTRVRTGMRLLLHKQRSAAASAAATGVSPSPVHIIDKVKKLVTPHGDPCHEGGESSSKIKAASSSSSSPSPSQVHQEHDSKKSQQPTLQEMPQAKRIKTKKPPPSSSCVNGGDAMEILRQIPSVSTRGDGPSGKRIEGILYKYNRGQVCIVCVCHGRFLSPSEFVMHAGGKPVDNPMKHITVSSNHSF